MTRLLTRLAQRLHRCYAVRGNVRVGPDVHIGLGSVLWAPRQLTVGGNVHIGKGCTIQVDGSIGTGVLIANRVGIVGRTDHALRQVGSLIRDADWVGHHPERLSKPVRIEDDVWIGYGAVVLSGITVGRGAVVAAGAVVTCNVRPYEIVAGNPARPVGRRFTEGEIAAHERLISRSA
ncbi:acyltransferase [Streptomyces cahuitamycinicus]|uniref:Acetyltransferase n=1 Tax=Streptomyces cahuitamycinicus TaxID=2070367 RepID=A0A2N8TW09_9ACTN|nr:DapH/DapD/GlmU-related protein [Streptomyces cahuitamycinicus]PNG23215.1 acetyltransferase [Streptomyces cahuitamycinicus]